MDFKELDRKYNTEFTNKLLKNEHVFYEIYKACGNKILKGCGSYLFDGQKYAYCDLMYDKQELLYNAAKDVKAVLEIGTYMGHSLLIMLLANPAINITCIDISDEFTRPAVDVLNKHFNTCIKFIHSDSLTALKSVTSKFDFFHIDGYHSNDYIKNEFNLIKKLNNRTDKVLKVIFDDQSCLIKLQNEIDTTHKVVKKVIPPCKWNNVYYEIQL